MNFLSGKKMLIVVLVTAIAQLVKLLTGHDLTQWAQLLFQSVGWGDAAASPAVGMTTEIVITAFTLWAAVKGLLRIIREKKAGASLKEAGTVVGEVKGAIAAGIIPPVTIQHPEDAIPPPEPILNEVKARNKDVDKRVA